MGKLFSAKRGLNHHKTSLEELRNSKRVKQNLQIEEDDASPVPTSSPTSSGNESGGDELMYKEPSTYDNLLLALRSNINIANAYKRRQRQEEGKSDSEEDEPQNSASIDASAEEDASEEANSMEAKSHEHDIVGIVDDSEDSESEDDEDASDSDLEPNLGQDVQSTVEASSPISSFHAHLGYNLSEVEVKNLLNHKRKYKWKLSALGTPNCKWVGTGECLLKENDVSPNYGLKPRLYKHWLEIYNMSGGNDFHSSKQKNFFSLFDSYRDILHSNRKPFYLKGGAEEDSSTMDAYIMHSLNHIVRTRDLIKKNEAKIAKCQEISKDDLCSDDSYLDHGFTRPKILILLPFRSIAARVVKRLIQLTPQKYKKNVEHQDRFISEFATQDDEGSMSEEPKSKKSLKPSDYQALFGGNCDDDFMIGIKFTRRSIKLYSDFYSSDMIVASPLKVHSKIGVAEVKKEKDVDFLSSIEVLIIDHADVITMQNWAFLTPVLEQLNRIPSNMQHCSDVMRVRKWYLEGHARFYRQSIILSYYANPDINASFNHHCLNYRGKAKLLCDYKGILPKVLLPVRQIYERFDAKSVADVDDARLEYFIKKVFPKIKDSVEGGIMLFISSYFEYVRLRNFLKAQNASFCLLGDYTKPSDISRARVWFFQGRRKIMLYTERAHFYHRYKIRGIQNLIIYSLPERKEFYPEVLNMLEGATNVTCTVLFSQFDQLRLERIVGTSHAKKMSSSEKDVFVFC